MKKIKRMALVALVIALCLAGCGDTMKIAGMEVKPDGTSLDIHGRDIGITDWAKLSQLTGLKTLDLEHTNISDLSMLSALTELEELDITRCEQVTDLTPLTNLKKLRRLSLTATNVADLSPLTELPELKSLYIKYGNCDLSQLKGLDLEYLGLERATDYLAPIAEMKNLKSLYVYTVGGMDTSCVSELTSLEHLKLYTEVADLTPLAGLTNLKTLDIQETTDDVSPLCGLNNLEELAIRGDNTDVSVLSTLSNLKKLTIRSHSLMNIDSAYALSDSIPGLQLELEGMMGY